MSPYRQRGARTWTVTLTTRVKTYVRLATGTRDKALADEMQEMLTAISRRGSRWWDLVDALIAKRITVSEMHDYWKAQQIDELRARLADVDLAPEIDAWQARIRKEKAPETARKYLQQVEWLFPFDDDDLRLPVLRSTVTRAWLKHRLAAVPGSNTNRNHYAAAWSSVLADLVEADLLERNPMADITVPAPNVTRGPGREKHIDRLEDVLRLIEAMPAGVHRALTALREGTGMEMQAALRTTMSDLVDWDNRVVWAHGQKNTHRDRQVIVDEWAWVYVVRWVKSQGFLPGAPLFRISEKRHRVQHTAACKTLRSEGVAIPATYPLHACRNTYAVRHIRAGDELGMIANNLGHADTRLVQSLYGKFKPTITDIIRAGQRGKRETR